MPSFSQASLAQLATCHPDLQKLFNEVIKHWDCTIIEGYRDQAAQEAAFAAGKSKLHYPNGNHNKNPSTAVDAMPYPINWEDINGIKAFAAHVFATASQLDIPLRWGGNWKTYIDDTHSGLVDMDHFELTQPTEI